MSSGGSGPSWKKLAVGFRSGVGFAAPSYLSDSKRSCCLVTAGTREGDGCPAISVGNMITFNRNTANSFQPDKVSALFSVVKSSAPLLSTWFEN